MNTWAHKIKVFLQVSYPAHQENNMLKSSNNSSKMQTKGSMEDDDHGQRRGEDDGWELWQDSAVRATLSDGAWKGKGR